MLLCFFPDFKSLDQSSYASALSKLLLFSYTCPHCGGNHFIFYGYYTRSFIVEGSSISLDIQRALCKKCGTTHAILPSCLIPFSRHPLASVCEMLDPDADLQEMTVRLQLGLDTLKRMRTNYSLYWRSLLSDWGSFSLVSLTEHCLRSFHRQFMQIRGLRLIHPPT